jgi:hypothetical protein
MNLINISKDDESELIMANLSSTPNPIRPMIPRILVPTKHWGEGSTSATRKGDM